MKTIRLLIIDDEAPILETLSLALGLEDDFVVTTLRDVAQWRETIDKFHPDIVLVDYRMPEMNGDLLIQALNASGLRASIQVVGLFSATPFSLAEVQRLGADVFFEKPFNIDHLVSSIRQQVCRRNSDTQ